MRKFNSFARLIVLLFACFMIIRLLKNVKEFTAQSPTVVTYVCVYKSRLEHVSLPPLKVISIRLYLNKLHKTIHFNLKDASFSRSLSVTHPDCNNPARHPARSSRGTHTLCLLTALPTLPHIFCLILSFYLFRVFFFSLLSKRDLGQSVKTLNLTPNGSED